MEVDEGSCVKIYFRNFLEGFLFIHEVSQENNLSKCPNHSDVY